MQRDDSTFTGVEGGDEVVESGAFVVSADQTPQPFPTPATSLSAARIESIARFGDAPDLTPATTRFARGDDLERRLRSV